MIDGLDVWDSLTEEARRHILATVQAQAQARAHADKDTYASNFSGDASTVDIYAARREGAKLILAYLFDSWEWCPAQSGSDWNYHNVYRGEATFVGGTLVANAIERLRNAYIHEYQEEHYDRAGALAEVRASVARGA